MKKFNLEKILGAKKLDINSLEEITKKECKNKEALGIGAGTDLNHCLYLGSKYGDKDFLDKVKYYRYSNTKEHPEFKGRNICCIIEFYGERK